MRYRTLLETAEEHKAADAACGREWVCACGACRTIRRQRAQCDSCGEYRKNLLSDCANLQCRSRQRDLQREQLNQTRAERDWNGHADRADLDRTEPYAEAAR